jgi:hypothetical protein
MYFGEKAFLTHLTTLINLQGLFLRKTIKQNYKGENAYYQTKQCIENMVTFKKTYKW